MTAAFTYMMHQTATYWAPGVNDGYGGQVWADPVVIKCRWSQKTDMIKNAQGREVVSSATVHVDRPLKAGGMLAKGEFVGVPGDDALEIINVSEVPSLSALEELHKVWL